jgi:hypothetical protein
MSKITLKNKFLLLGAGLGWAVVFLAGCQSAGTSLSSVPVVSTSQPKSANLQISTVPSFQLVSLQPRDGSKNVVAEAVIKIGFSEPIDALTVTTDNVSLRYINPELNEGELIVNYQSLLSEDGKELQLIPAEKFLTGETVELLVTCDLKSREGKKLDTGAQIFWDNICFTGEFEVAS